MEFKIIKFSDGEFQLDVNISKNDNTVWLNAKELAALFNRDESVINKHIRKIYKEGELNEESTQAKIAFMLNSRRYYMRYYNLDMILLIGLKIGSNRGTLLKSFLKKRQKPNYNQNNERIIIYNNGKIDIPININLKEENAWASVKQMAALFETSDKNIYQHINNIFSEGELDYSVFKDSLTTEQNSVSEDSSVTDLKLNENIPVQKEIFLLADDGKYYLTKVYNLDVILAVGYRVKSVIAMKFRRWVTFVLKKILTSGYYLDLEKCEHCNKVLELQNKVLELKNEQLKEIRYYPGDEFRGFIEIKRFLETAKKEIIIIDNYFGHEFDDVLKNIDVKKTVITNHKNTKIESNENYNVIKTNYYHDRYIFVDELCYTFGQSFKDIGLHECTARRMLGFNIEEVHQLLKKWKGKN